MTSGDAALSELVARSHRVSAGEIPSLVEAAGRDVGLSGARVYLVDLQQSRLVALPADAAPDGGATLDIDGSLAGLAYRTQETQRSRDGATAWVPLIDGVERLGVLKATAPSMEGQLLEASAALAGIVALLVVSKSTYSEELITQERSRAMTIQAELLWAFMPPRTIGTRQVTSSALLEPAYDAGGDAFDHSLTDNVLHLSLLDAMGHDLASGGASAAALAASRATRRDGGTLTEIATTIDETLNMWIPDRMMTAVIARLDLTDGSLTWINCGHPTPLLIRDGHVLPQALQRTPLPPLGLGLDTGNPPTEHHTRLQPGDRILLYSDGVIEARTTEGTLFGEQRLGDTVIRSMTSGDNAPETLRRLLQNIHHDHQLRDDATLLLAHWHPT
ncbi:serine/threonine protein phosphatase [Streptomyces sp. WAC 01325]|uniref:PP2C family protein-serine/threonine phosphatase n=1 Tax=Streptomyces sp. WAC 01325 TaxID=2203202 RepID=UPI000F87F77E|nr:PP2C family protein-serine/threonine phosphatase [Streptomyces sp. WAC 01325]RSM92397.1 serine/threonine protein phosphatase [Streptomyces sp. WAC 01325]